MASGQVVIKEYADGDAGIDIYIGPAQTGNAPFRVLDNSGNVLALVNAGGNSNFQGYLGKQQQPTTGTTVMAATDFNFFCDTTGGNVTITLVNPGNASQGSSLGRLSRTVRVVKQTANANTVTVNVASGGGIDNNTNVVLSVFGQACEFISMPLSDTTGQWFINQNSIDLVGINTQTTTPYVPVYSDDFILLDATAGAFAVNLPAANSTVALGREWLFKKKDASGNAVTINRAGADTIEGAASTALAAQYNMVRLRTDGVATWYKVQ